MERKCTNICFIKQELYRFQSKLEGVINVDPPTAARIFEYLEDLEHSLTLIIPDVSATTSTLLPPAPASPNMVTIHNIFTTCPSQTENPPERTKNKKFTSDQLCTCKCGRGRKKTFSF